MQCIKNIRAEDNKKEWVYASYIRIYTCVKRMTQNKNDSINLILQGGCIVDRYYCVVLPASGFPYLIMCSRQCKGKVATTYIAMRTKNN